jgi:hypothetical protein
MRIAVFGSESSRAPVEHFAHLDEFEATCHSLAKMLAADRHVIMVESDAMRTADSYIVEAIGELGRAREQCVVEAWYRSKGEAAICRFVSRSTISIGF